jgi:hypothetical protein
MADARLMANVRQWFRSWHGDKGEGETGADAKLEGKGNAWGKASSPQGGVLHKQGEGPTLGAVGDMPEELHGREAGEDILAQDSGAAAAADKREAAEGGIGAAWRRHRLVEAEPEDAGTGMPEAVPDIVGMVREGVRQTSRLNRWVHRASLSQLWRRARLQRKVSAAVLCRASVVARMAQELRGDVHSLPFW